MKKMIPSSGRWALGWRIFIVSVDGCCTCAEENSGCGDTTLKNTFAFCASYFFWSSYSESGFCLCFASQACDCTKKSKVFSLCSWQLSSCGPFVGGLGSTVCCAW